MKSSVTRLLFLMLVLLGLSSSVHAEEYLKRGASVEDYEQALDRVLDRKRGVGPYHKRPKKAGKTKTATKQPKAPVQIKTTPMGDIYKPPSEDTDQSDGVSIYFGFDSAQLTSDATVALRRLGEALAKPKYTGKHWIVEGHTDATGSAEYNLILSKRRARSAYRYLVDECGIDPRLLTATGRGESDPYDRDNPYAEMNRRVRVKPNGE